MPGALIRENTVTDFCFYLTFTIIKYHFYCMRCCHLGRKHIFIGYLPLRKYWYNLINISNLFSVQSWKLKTSSRSFYGFSKKLISWGHFIFSNWWLTVLIASVNMFKRMKTLKLILTGSWVIATGWEFRKSPELGPSLQHQIKKELDIFIVSYTNILKLNFFL